MKVITYLPELRATIQHFRQSGKTIGFTPTMGALHKGHISLVQYSKNETDISVVSIFVNPTQFNDRKDLDKYPRDLFNDTTLLKGADVDILFTPTIKQIYPGRLKPLPPLDISDMAGRLEGEFRPGHFEGVVQVVKRLLDVVCPDVIFMGQKDFQQFTIIQYMIDHFDLPTRLRVCPIIREKNGLAMSSRNRRLTSGLRQKAGIIHDTLLYVKTQLGKVSVPVLEERAMHRLDTPDFYPEYFKIVDGRTLESIETLRGHDYIVACAAVWAGEVRLIDNMILRGPSY